MRRDERAQWFDTNKTLMEDAYTAAQLPWQQSGFGLHSTRTAADWATLRRPIAACIGHAGSLLDIGCANGYLARIIAQFLNPGGMLLVAEYGSSRNRVDSGLHIDHTVMRLGFTIAATTTGVLQGVEMTRVAVVKKMV